MENKTESFPTNISFDEIMAFYLDQNPEVNIGKLYSLFCPDDDKDEEDEDIYSDIMASYLSEFYSKGTFLLISYAEDFIKKIRENGAFRSRAEEFNLDFSHLYGMTNDELHLLAIPFDTLDIGGNFGDIIMFDTDSILLYDGHIFKVNRVDDKR